MYDCHVNNGFPWLPNITIADEPNKIRSILALYTNQVFNKVYAYLSPAHQMLGDLCLIYLFWLDTFMADQWVGKDYDQL